LTPDERKQVALHAGISARLFLARYKGKDTEKIAIARAIKQHHAPKTKLAKVLFIADFYDALRNRPNYKTGEGPLSKNKALEIIQSYQLMQLNPNVFN